MFKYKNIKILNMNKMLNYKSNKKTKY